MRAVFVFPGAAFWASAKARSSMFSVVRMICLVMQMIARCDLHGRVHPASGIIVGVEHRSSAAAARDTTATARHAQLSVFRELGPIGRLEASFEMSEEMRRVLADGVRARHPEYDEAAVAQALLRLLYGPSLAKAVVEAIARR
jgi:hypothetical protein